MWILATEEHYIALPPQELCLFPHTQKKKGYATRNLCAVNLTQSFEEE